MARRRRFQARRKKRLAPSEYVYTLCKEPHEHSSTAAADVDRERMHCIGDCAHKQFEENNPLASLSLSHTLSTLSLSLSLELPRSF